MKFQSIPEYESISDDTILWRYMDLPKFLDVLINKHIVFTRPDLFEDVFESYPYKFREASKEAFYRNGEKTLGDFIDDRLVNSHRVAKYHIYISCWHINSFESAGMWKLYGKHSDSLVIKTTVKKLKQSLIDPNNSWVNHLFYGKVNYDLNLDKLTEEFCDLVKKKEAIEIDIRHVLYNKRESFEHEKEFRVLGINNSNLFGHPDLEKLSDSELKKITPSFQSIKCNIDNLIDEIIIAPDAQNWIVDLIKSTFEHLGYNFKVNQSELYKLK
ncbi:DUF2971 domain-containing protein [Acinetobacter gerneri]|uniref:DUF2971 domain-containing protein n=1 Tax=Acinetobacter gerneri TaxID=202952 RepID=UPI003215FCC6